MYDLWKERRITKPSEYWNMSLGDKLFLRAFHNRYVEEKNKERKEIITDKTPIFPVIVI